MRCARSVTAGLYQRSVSLVCHVISSSPVSDARISWEGSQHLRPTARSGWPPGVMFDRDDEYMAYLRQVNLPLKYNVIIMPLLRKIGGFRSSNAVAVLRWGQGGTASPPNLAQTSPNFWTQ